MMRKMLVVVVIAGVVAAANSIVVAGEKVVIGKLWPADQRVSMEAIDHTSWDMLLKRHVDEDGYVDYRAWNATGADRSALQQYLASLSRANPTAQASREAKLAFWINAYNAVTVEGILQKYPLDSIRDHTPKLFGYHIWHDLLLVVGDENISLDSIEHKILRPMGEPRIHFAIVCASIGCPPLRNEAYVAQNLDQQLADNARAFFSNPNQFKYDPTSGVIRLSDILDWFKEDFGSSDSDRLKTIAPFLPTDVAQQAAASGQGKVRHFGNYDWGLNDQAKKGN